MIKISKIVMTCMVLIYSCELNAQRFNAGLVFQYHVLKQIDVNSKTIAGANSHDIFKVKENNWKVFGAGQSIVVGMMGQLDYKKFYVTAEWSYNLNTYRYTLYYPIAPSNDEKVIFKVLYEEMEIPVYVGYQFQSTNLVRYSVFGGALITIPLFIEEFVDESGKQYVNNRYSSSDLRYILYSDEPYANTIFGFVVHVASLAKIDLRYIHRLGSPGKTYDVKFNTIGIAVTYYLPLNFRKKKFYYEG